MEHEQCLQLKILFLLGYNVEMVIQQKGIDFWWWGDKNLVRGESTGGRDIFLEGVKQYFAIPEAKLGHKIQQNYNRLNYKMYYKSVIIDKNVLLPYIQNKLKNLNKYNNIIIINDNNRVIPCQIIRYFQMLAPLLLRFCPTLHHLQIMPKRTISENVNPQLSTVLKPLRPYWSGSCRRYNLKGVC